MSFQSFPSALLEAAVNEFSKLPGIGKKTALRLVLYLLHQPTPDVEKFGNTLIRLKHEIHYCKRCHNISDTEICDICADSGRDQSIICVVENIKDVISIENTQQFNGLYHVLGGIISPMEGIAPSDLEIDSLVERVAQGDIQEIFMALSPTMEGDTTAYYLYRKLSACQVKITTIARGIAIGNELEYADEITLGRSIVNRTPFSY
ncbi:recombination mediator RecR [Microbacter margulisiae]|uniref:Recombination protein RecR n=1 Tax=Microbacter margulisiae TaxID=1350067 RepID=A0A7W5H1A5_9PORP|nr:recombination mediator RecR [Microbacter margulisiae]MBB3186439.1 recombination protein RecR [Microbacter margulisiae]